MSRKFTVQVISYATSGEVVAYHVWDGTAEEDQAESAYIKSNAFSDRDSYNVLQQKCLTNIRLAENSHVRGRAASFPVSMLHPKEVQRARAFEYCN